MIIFCTTVVDAPLVHDLLADAAMTAGNERVVTVEIYLINFERLYESEMRHL